VRTLHVRFVNDFPYETRLLWITYIQCEESLTGPGARGLVETHGDEPTLDERHIEVVARALEKAHLARLSGDVEDAHAAFVLETRFVASGLAVQLATVGVAGTEYEVASTRVRLPGDRAEFHFSCGGRGYGSGEQDGQG
jgi:hypothetical protein